MIDYFHHELQISDLKKKQENQVQLSREKQKSDEAAKRLQAEIQYIKSQKVCSHFLYFMKFYKQKKLFNISICYNF